MAKDVSTSTLLEVDGVTKVFTRAAHRVMALNDVSLRAAEGEFVTIIGPSGCGKSTLLHIVGGFEAPTAGSVTLADRKITKPGRDRGMVFQQATLYPWWTIERNVAWPLMIGGLSRHKALERATELLSLVGLEGFSKAYPGELSGGMNQRAALARTLSLDPKLLLMDEPFGALDAQTRELMQEELNRIWQAAGITVVFVTHDIYEAVFLGDRVQVMSNRPGQIIEDVRIELPRPRHPQVKDSAQFSAYHAKLWAVLRAQVSRDEWEPN